jgi:hypothetical protein
MVVSYEGDAVSGDRNRDDRLFPGTKRQPLGFIWRSTLPNENTSRSIRLTAAALVKGGNYHGL